MMVRRTFISTWLLLLPVALITAAEPQSSSAVRDALRYGLAGNLDEQRSLLNSILAVQPNLIIARGHAGFVRQDKEWVDFEELSKQPAELEKLSEYEQARQAAPDTLEGQLELANWCDQHGLEQQGRAHLSRVLDFDGNHAAARSRLGFVKQGDDWVSRSERRTEDMRERESTVSLQKWRPQIRAIVADLSNTHGGSPADVRDRGKRLAKLAAITDPAAVPALELELEAFLDSVDRQPGSTEHKIADVLVPLVRTIGSIPHPQAGQSLARIATSIALTVPMETPEALVMESSGPRFPSAAELDESVTPLVERLSREVAAVYRTAITQLKNQSRDSFVPILLSGLSSPIQGEYYTFRERDGDVIVRLF